jgi:hypothetical protein
MILRTERALFLTALLMVVCSFFIPVCTALDKEEPVPVAPGTGSAGPVAGEEKDAQLQMAALPLSFIPNQGQYDPAVSYVVSGPRSTLFLTPGAVVVRISETAGNDTVTRVVRQTFPGASGSPDITGSRRHSGTANFFLGNDPAKWQEGVPTWGEVVYRDLYPGIDLRYTGTTGILKREFVVAPGIDPARIRLRYEGADRIVIDDSGALVVNTGASTLTESPVVCYQLDSGSRVPVAAAYHKEDNGDVDFSVGDYDPTLPLVIDPALVYSTYLGGSGDDHGFAIAVDGSGDTYITGETGSSDFPTGPGSFDPTYTGGTEVFVTKLNEHGTGLSYSTYLGGSGDERGTDIAVDAGHNAYVTGYTTSSDFPMPDVAYNRTFGGNEDAFVTKLNLTGASLNYSTYLGGHAYDNAYGIAVDSIGNAYVTGTTSSDDFPVNPGAYDTTYNGNNDIFVTKLNAAGTGLGYSTFVGGSNTEYGRDITVDQEARAYVTGNTASTNFPTTAGAYDPSLSAGTVDAFVMKMNLTGAGLTYSTYLGGSDDDFAFGITVDGDKNAYITGHTASADFPTTPGAFDTSYNGGLYDVFVSKLDTGGSILEYSTFLGGPGYESGDGIVVDGGGNAYVTGSASSSGFPTTTGAYNQTFSGDSDLFITRLNPVGSGLSYSTFLGGAQVENGGNIAIDYLRNVYVTGSTNSHDFPTTPAAYWHTVSGGYDAIVAKVSFGAGRIGVVRNNRAWLLDASGNGAFGSGDLTYTFGKAGDKFVTGDWDGDGATEIGVVRNNKTWLLDASGDGAFGAGDLTYTFGKDGDVPVTGDWDGDGMTEIGVVRDGRTWLLDKSGNGAFGAGDLTYTFGKAGDRFVTGDWDGDDTTEIGVVRDSKTWFLDRSGDGAFGAGDRTYTYGKAGDVPVTGDWDGDGMTGIGVVRDNKTWLLDKSGDGAFGAGDLTYTFGKAGDVPVTGVW